VAPVVLYSKDYIPTLDGLRAIAITMVISSHAITSSQFARWANGYAGVLIFFSLSGYLITTHLIREFAVSGRISLKDFYARRFFRILPPVLLYLVILGMLAAIGKVPFDSQSLRAALFFYANYADHSWVIGHFWSLAVEEHFYLLWPVLLIVFSVRNGWRTAVAFAFLVCALRLAVVHLHLLGNVFQDAAHGNFHSDLVFDTLLWGCCLGFYLYRRRIRPVNSTISTVISLVAALMLLAPGSLGLTQTTLLTHLLPTILVGSIVMAPGAPIGRFLELRSLRFVGKLSYSLYIWQQLFFSGPGPHIAIPFALTAVIICALLSYKLIEVPAIRLGRRLIRGRENPFLGVPLGLSLPAVNSARDLIQPASEPTEP
jgi:peptidoglycan/LPS O-acetylase OafA/YrhL